VQVTPDSEGRRRKPARRDARTHPRTRRQRDRRLRDPGVAGRAWEPEAVPV